LESWNECHMVRPCGWVDDIEEYYVVSKNILPCQKKM
jgi:hypothetical protein